MSIFEVLFVRSSVSSEPMRCIQSFCDVWYRNQWKCFSRWAHVSLGVIVPHIARLLCVLFRIIIWFRYLL